MKSTDDHKNFKAIRKQCTKEISVAKATYDKRFFLIKPKTILKNFTTYRIKTSDKRNYKETDNRWPCYHFG